MSRGAFITLEGGEGVGKSTSLAAIEAHLTARGLVPTLTREPGGTPIGEAIRQLILDGQHGDMTAEAEALLMFAARAQHLERVIRPALDNGHWVVCDRFSDASRAYQGGGRGVNRSLLDGLTLEIQRGIVPDLTLLLDAPVEIGMARIAERPYDHFEREDVAFFTRVRQAYLEQAASEPDRFRIIDATGLPDQVRARIEAELDAFCARFAGAGTNPS
jgi:dTMP kinase